MARYKVQIAYDGTEFLGFQRQSSKLDKRTVQAVIEAALRRLGWQGSSILAAGRTDSGVHASGQVVAFDFEWKHSLEALRAALNANLPEDVAARTVQLADADFHPRFDAIARRYQYRIYCEPVRDPIRERFAWRLWPEVEFARLQQAANLIHGKHDFGAFGTSPRRGGTTVRNVYLAAWGQEGSDLVFEITADAFLYRMVRRLVSFQVKVGQRVLEMNDFHRSLSGSQGEMVKGIAPARGLYLVEVIYGQPTDVE